MFNIIFVFLRAFYVYVKLDSLISVHNTVQSDYTIGPQRHDDKHAIEKMLVQIHRVIKKWNAMDDNILAADEILKQFGNFESLRLDNILDSNGDDDDAPNLIHPSPYSTIDALPSHLMNDDRHLNIWSLNTQSINSKFDSILALLDIAKNQNVNFHIICIQESWL